MWPLNNLNKSIGETLMIKVFSKPNCPFCVRAKEYLNEIEIQYEEIDITKDAMAHSFLVSEGHRTVPQIYKDSHLLLEGGYQGLVQHSKEQINQLIGDTNVNQYEYEL